MSAPDRARLNIGERWIALCAGQRSEEKMRAVEDAAGDKAWDMVRQEAKDATSGLVDAHVAVVVALNRVEACQMGSPSNRNYLHEAWLQLEHATLMWDEALADLTKYLEGTNETGTH